MHNSVLYMCAQSMFKLHPRFDAAVKGVLEASSLNCVVFTSGRRPQWTVDFRRRLRLTLGEVLMERVRSDMLNVEGDAIHLLLCIINVIRGLNSFVR